MFNWFILSRYIDISEVRAHPECSWNRGYLSQNKSITLNDVMTLSLPNSMKEWDEYYLSKCISMCEVRTHSEYRWSRFGLSQNKEISMNDVKTLSLPNATGDWSMKYLSNNREIILTLMDNWYLISQYIPMIEVRTHPEYSWDRGGLSRNKEITLNDVETLCMPNASGEWDHYLISKYIDMEEVRTHPEYRWDRCSLSQNKNITLNDVMTLSSPFDTDEWNWSYLSKNISMKEIRAHPELPWSIEGLTRNSTITIHDIDMITIGRWDQLQRDTLPMSITKSMYDVEIVCT